MSARCGTHIGLTAVGTCARCGDYVCSTCLDTSYPTLCVRCAARLPHGIAWEDRRAGSWPRRFTRTLSQMATRPRVAFPGPVRTWRPVLFAYLCCVLVAGIWTVVAWANQPGRMPESLGLQVAGGGLTALLLAMGMMLGVLLLAGSFAAGLFMAGRRVGLWRYSLRAMAYAQSVMVLSTLLDLTVLGALTALGLEQPARVWVTLLAELLWVVGTLRVGHAAARGLGLSSVRASFAAMAPTTWIAYLAVVRLVTGLGM